jgi:lipopolysaccharide transport system permease protein
MNTPRSGAKFKTLPLDDRCTPSIRISVEAQSTLQLAAKPLVTIQQTKSWAALNLAHIWSYRELLYFLALRDLKIRYKQTVLGMLWVVLQPLLMTLIFAVVLGRLIRVPSDGIPYPLFAYTGIMVWIFFSSAVSITSNSLVGNSGLITKVYFPRVIIPIATIIARLVDLLVSCIILVGLMIYYRVGFTFHILMVPFMILLVALLALALGMWSSAVNVKYRDVSLFLPVVIQLWMFVSPVVYPLSLVPPKYRLIYSLNPLVGVLDGFRAALLGQRFDLVAITLSLTITLVFLIYAIYSFGNHERTFADLV